MAGSPDKDIRVDKWLWAARFYKTRTNAAQAIAGGRVQVNGKRVKPAMAIKPGDLLEIAVGDMHWRVIVRALNAQRRPAAEARLLYDETEDSLMAREALLERKRLENEPSAEIKGRPTKRERRHLQRLLS